MARNAAASIGQPVESRSLAGDRTPSRISDRQPNKRLERPNERRMTDDGRFAIDLSLVAPGMVMEWKRHTIMAMDDKRNQVLVQKYHWQPVTNKEQPQIMGHLATDPDAHIIVDGLGLYIRPAYLNEEAENEGRADTDWQLRQQLDSLRMPSGKQVGGKNTYIKKQTVQVSQPVE